MLVIFYKYSFKYCGYWVISLFLLFNVFLLSARAVWSHSRLHKVHMLVRFLLDFTDSTIFHSIEYFILLLFKSHRWFASWIQFLYLFSKGLSKEDLCSLYLDLNVLADKRKSLNKRNKMVTQCPHNLNEY